MVHLKITKEQKKNDICKFGCVACVHIFIVTRFVLVYALCVCVLNPSNPAIFFIQAFQINMTIKNAIHLMFVFGSMVHTTLHRKIKGKTSAEM